MIDKEIEERLRKANQLFNAENYSQAAAEVVAVLHHHPDYIPALFSFAIITRAAENFGVSMLASRRVYELAPDSPQAINNLGSAFADCGDEETAAELYRKAFEKQPKAQFAQNLGSFYANRCQPELALEWFAKARAMPDADKVGQIDENESHALLALGRWHQGWKQYAMPIGKTRHRPDKSYDGAELWDGTALGKDSTLVIYGEQGIGDEIMFSSCILDALRQAHGTVIIDVQRRLKGLFARSFPLCEVYGTRTEESPYWMSRTNKPTHRTAMSRLPMFYRNTDADFLPGKAYLIADPHRRTMYRALLDSINTVNPRRLKIGLAWTGGMVNTGKDRRSLSPADLKPLMDQFPQADWFSLQYMEAPEGAEFGIRELPFATQTKDYDDTAALVAELDAVVTVQTAMVHLCGALGKRAFVIVSNRPVWRYGQTGKTMRWYESVSLHRQPEDGNWQVAIDEAAAALKEYIASGAHNRKLPRAAA